MNKITLLAALFFLLTKAGIVNAQLGSLNIKNDYLKGPVCLYKKTVQKDFAEKFGKYEPAYSQIAAWYIYDKEGRKTFSQKIGKHNKKIYEREIYLYEKGKLMVRASALVNISDNSIFQDGYHSYFFYKHHPDKTIEECRYGLGGKEMVDLTEKFDANNNLIERYARLGTNLGFKLTKKYDSNSKLIDKTEYDGHGKIKYKITWKRDAKGNVTERVEYNADGTLKNKRTFKYNTAGKETEVIWYKSDGSIDWGYEYKYKNDTLVLEYNSFSGNEKNSNYLLKYQYDNNNLLIKQTTEVYDGKKIDKYSIVSYNNNRQKAETKFFTNQKLTEKHIFSNYDGKQHQLMKGEVYDSTGSFSEAYEYKYDKYGNEISYEKYKVVTSFGEKKKIPVEKQKVEISYYDGNPKFTVKVAFEDKKNSQKKKEKYISFNTMQFGSNQPKLYLFRKQGVTGGKEVEVHKGGLRSYQVSMFDRFYKPAFVVESGNYIVLIKRPRNNSVWSLENCHYFQY